MADEVTMGSNPAGMTKNGFIEMIAASLKQRKDQLKAEFAASSQQVGTKFVAIDDLLPADVAKHIATAFPDSSLMRLMDSFRERKYTSKAYDKFDPSLGQITFAFQDPKIVALVEEITGITEQVPDSLLYAGGLSAMAEDHFLGPHIDNSHDSGRQYYRTLNLLYYVTPDWPEANGGNLQLWNVNVSKCVTIHSKFNRLVLMETTPTSWHSVNRVTAQGTRKCVSNYYFSKRPPTGADYFNITAFSAPPTQPLLRLWSTVDAALRQLVRKIKPSGVGPVDVYDGPPR